MDGSSGSNGWGASVGDMVGPVGLNRKIVILKDEMQHVRECTKRTNTIRPDLQHSSTKNRKTYRGVGFFVGGLVVGDNDGSGVYLHDVSLKHDCPFNQCEQVQRNC